MASIVMLKPAKTTEMKRIFINAALAPEGAFVPLKKYNEFLKNQDIIIANAEKLQEMDRVLSDENELDRKFKSSVRRYLKSCGNDGHRLEIRYQDSGHKILESITIWNKKGNTDGPSWNYNEGNYPADASITYSYLKNGKETGKSVTVHPNTGITEVRSVSRFSDNSASTSFAKDGSLLEVYDNKNGLKMYQHDGLKSKPAHNYVYSHRVNLEIRQEEKLQKAKERLEEKIEAKKTPQTAEQTGTENAPRKEPEKGVIKNVLNRLKKTITE